MNDKKSSDISDSNDLLTSSKTKRSHHHHNNHRPMGTIHKSANVSHASRILKSKKSAVDVFSNRYYNSNLVGDHLNFLPLKSQNNYELNEPSSSSHNLDKAELIKTYNLLETKKQHKIKRPKSAFFQSSNQTTRKELTKINKEPLNNTIKSTVSTQITNLDTSSLASASLSTSGSGYSSLSSNPYTKLKHLSRQQADFSFKNNDDSTARVSDFLADSLELNQLFLSGSTPPKHSSLNESSLSQQSDSIHKPFKSVKYLSSSMKNKTNKIFNPRSFIFELFFFINFKILILFFILFF